MDEVVITLRRVKLGTAGQMYEAWLGEELLCTRTEPFLAAARVLQARGVPGETQLVMKHFGDDTCCLRSTVAVAAGLAVSEGDRPPRFTKYVPYARHLDSGVAKNGR